MLLNEFIYFDKDHAEPTDNSRYDISNDKSVLKSNDLRKTERLTFKVLRDLRKAGEAREKEKHEDLALVRVMYKMPTEEQGGELT
jgi:hypothetical protein